MKTYQGINVTYNQLPWATALSPTWFIYIHVKNKSLHKIYTHLANSVIYINDLGLENWLSA